MTPRRWHIPTRGEMSPGRLAEWDAFCEEMGRRIADAPPGPAPTPEEAAELRRRCRAYMEGVVASLARPLGEGVCDDPA